jgi:hypothetical protein
MTQLVKPKVQNEEIMGEKWNIFFKTYKIPSFRLKISKISVVKSYLFSKYYVILINKNNLFVH